MVFATNCFPLATLFGFAVPICLAWMVWRFLRRHARGRLAKNGDADHAVGTRDTATRAVVSDQALEKQPDVSNSVSRFEIWVHTINEDQCGSIMNLMEAGR